MSGTADPLSAHFDVVLDQGEPFAETYTFKKPDIRYTIEVGYRALDIRRRSAGFGGSDISGIDYATVQTSRYFAMLELYLVAADANPMWAFTTGPDKKQVVDFSKFPLEREETVVRLGVAFEEQVGRFRTRRNPDEPPRGTETVGGQPNTG